MTTANDNPTIRTVVGTGEAGYTGDGGPAAMPRCESRSCAPLIPQATCSSARPATTSCAG